MLSPEAWRISELASVDALPQCACDGGTPGVAFVTPQPREAPWDLSERRPLHVNAKGSSFPTSPETFVRGSAPSQASANLLSELFSATHLHLSATLGLLALFQPGGVPGFFFFFPLQKGEKNIRSFLVIEIHDKLQVFFFLFSCSEQRVLEESVCSVHWVMCKLSGVVHVVL